MRKLRFYPLVPIGLMLISACAPFFRFGIGPQTNAVALGDLDGDGDLDAYLANGENEGAVPDTIWLNDGQGRFSDSGHRIEERESWYVALADIDLDGDLDAIVGNVSAISIYRNYALDKFAYAQQGGFPPQEGSYVLAPAVGDLNGDGYPDVFAGSVNHRILVWFNDGEGKLLK